MSEETVNEICKILNVNRLSFNKPDFNGCSLRFYAKKTNSIRYFRADSIKLLNKVAKKTNTWWQLSVECGYVEFHNN